MYVISSSIHYLVSFAVLEIIKLVCSILYQAPELVGKFDQITYYTPLLVRSTCFTPFMKLC
jgi:hypothetical protein